MFVSLIKWNRTRAAVFYLIKIPADPDMHPCAMEMFRALITSECEAIQRQCSAGPFSFSSLFNDDIVSPDVVPSGIFIRAVSDVLQSRETSEPSQVPSLASFRHCLSALHSTKSFVLSTILSECPDPRAGAFTDPRPTLAESWFHAMCQVAKLATREETMDDIVKDLLVDTAIGLIILLFYPVLGKTLEERANAPGLSLDGPHSLIMTDFLAELFGIGPRLFECIAYQLAEKLPADFGPGRDCLDSMSMGAAIVGASLFRSLQGGLPPWAVESTPEVYRSLFFALRRDPSTFGLVLRMAMDVRLSPSPSGTRIGSVLPGELFAGGSFDMLSDDAKRKFVEQAVELCKQDNMTNWRRFKMVLKGFCGGKKKETDFQQKPALTRFEFERV